MNYCIDCIWEEISIPLKRYIKNRVANEQDCDDIYFGICKKSIKNKDYKYTGQGHLEEGIRYNK